MKKFFYLTILAICLGGCSSPAANDAGANIRTNVNLSELNNPDPNTLADANTAAATNVVYDKNGNPMNIKKGSGNVNAAPIPNAKQATYPASDNSEVASGMNNQGQMIETRTFKNNPTLQKIEKVYVELDKPTVTAYLKNGQKADLTTVKMEDPMKISAEDIINAVNASKGAMPAPTKQP